MAFLNNVSIARARTAGQTTVFEPQGVGSRAELVQNSYEKAVSVQTSDAPVLTEDPTTARVYNSPDGKAYCVPQAIVGKRQNNAQVPDVFFDVKAGKTTLMVSFDLAKPAAANDATPLLLVDNFGVRLVPSAGGTPLAFTDVAVTPVSNAGSVVFRLVAQTTVDENIVPGVLRTDTNAWFEVSADLHYRLQLQAAPAVPSPLDSASATSSTFGGSNAPTTVGQPTAVAQRMVMTRFNSDFIATVNQTPVGNAPSDVKTARVALTTPTHDGLSAYYPLENPHNRPIYARIMALDGANDSNWIATSDGYIRASAQPNQYYVLPDGFGLAIDAQTGLPAMAVLLVEIPATAGGAIAYRVRVSFGVVPWLAADRLERIRRTLRQEQDMAYADLVIGGYDKAMFTPSHLFDKLSNPGPPDTGTATASTAISIDAASGFELVLDCSMEFYTLLTTLVTSADGLKGNVDITLHTDANTAFTAQMPVQLTLGAPASVPLAVSVEDPGGLGGMHACAVNIANTAGVDVSADAILPTLLLKDEHMPYPSNAYDVNAVPQTIALKPGAKTRVLLVQGAQGGNGGTGLNIGGLGVNIDLKDLKITTATPELPPWSAVAINFSGVHLKFDPNQVLSKVHELASSTHMNTTAHLVSYLLKHPDQIPSSLAGLIGIHAQVQTGSSTPIDVFLTTDAPEKNVQIAFSFSDLLAGLKPDEPTFQWRRCNMFAAKNGVWSDWATNTGSDLFVTPVGI